MTLLYILNSVARERALKIIAFIIDEGIQLSLEKKVLRVKETKIEDDK